LEALLGSDQVAASGASGSATSKSPIFRQIIEFGRNYAPTAFFKVC
jgi:hypothetical protein